MDVVGPILVALAAAIGIDWVFGDPPNKIHPVAWLGTAINKAIPRLKGGNFELAKGIAFAVILVVLVGLSVQLAVNEIYLYAGVFALIAAAAIILKITIAIRGMERHAQAIVKCLEAGDLPGARKNLSMIVRRDTKDLGEEHILSATIECIGESTVDGIVGPIFYFSILGPGGAFAYRAINTLDSMIGYKDDYYQKIGWMSAKLDTAANYIPARITAFLMVLAARMIGVDWKSSLEILQRDHAKTLSLNAGYPMASIAGALRIKLEKIGHYSLGDQLEPASLAKCHTALSIMKLTVVLFCALVSVPSILILYALGWWNLILSFAWR